MNNDTIKAAEEHLNNCYQMGPDDSFLAGAEYMQAQKEKEIDETISKYMKIIDGLTSEIKELVEALGHANDLIERLNTKVNNLDENLRWYEKLIQKHKG